MATAPIERVHTRIWLEEPEPQDPYTTRAAFCHGYDVYGDMLGRARWADMLYLLFCGEAPTPPQVALLDGLAVALSNAGPRDPANHAAMCAGIGGSPSASALIAALAVGAGQHTGAREVHTAMGQWLACGTDAGAWQSCLGAAPPADTGIWPGSENPAGYDPHAQVTSTVVRQTLAFLAQASPGPHLPWLQAHRSVLEAAAGHPLAMTGVAACAFVDLGLSADQGEMLHLLLRLPGAAVHALEQRSTGYKRFPFFALDLQDDPQGGGR